MRAGTVSILVVVDWSRQLPAHARADRVHCRFQSLLSWMRSRHVEILDRCEHPIRCFNPCCRGSVAVDSAASIVGCCAPMTFQSLLSWIASRQPLRTVSAHVPTVVSILVVVDLVASHVTVIRVARSGFNPCCRGLVASTARSPSRGLECFNPCCRGLVASTSGCRGSRPPPASFNPCCRGSGRVNIALDGRTRCAMSVSILVVVDWSRQRARESRYSGSAELVSILVVVDWSRQPASAARVWACIECFNPCCRGLVASTALRTAAVEPA